MYSMCSSRFPFWCGRCESTYRWWSWLLLSTQNPRVHSPVVRAADCRSAGPRFNSGWKSWFTFMTGSDNLTNQIIQMFNNMSPITTVIATITRKSVKMVAELDDDTAPSRILDTIGQRLEGNSTVAKAATATAVALDTKSRVAQGIVPQLKSELAQYQQSRTEAKVLHAIAQDTERFRSRHRSCTKARKTCGSPGSRATRSTGQGSVDPRHRRLEDDGGSFHGRYSSI